MKKVFMEKFVSTVKIEAELERIENQLNQDYKRIDKKENPNSACSEKDEPEEDESEEDELEIDEPAQIDTKAVEPQPRKNIATQAFRKGYRDASDESRLDKVNRLHNKYLSAGPPDDVIFGGWHFDCPEITEEWDENCREDIVWKIHPPQNSETCALWAVIDQACIEGIVRIGWDSAQDWKDK
jgi:hypothetical protein